jgi:subtilase family serine protease
MRREITVAAGALALTMAVLGLASLSMPANTARHRATPSSAQPSPRGTSHPSAGGATKLTPSGATSPSLASATRPTAAVASGPAKEMRPFAGGRDRTRSVRPRRRHVFVATGAMAPPTDTQCERTLAADGVVQCFDPADIRTAYGVDSLIAAKDEGKGQTIVIIDSFGSPTIRGDLRNFDRGYKLVNPPSLRVLAPLGRVPFNPDNSTESGWAAETTLDVEWSHAMAPLARIVVLTSPVAETEGTVGLGDFLQLERYAFDHKLGNIISQSWAATENTLETKAGRDLVSQFEAFYARADRHHITILASTGDTGTQNPSNGSGTRTYAQPTVNFPASSPLITAVGGTSLRAARSGRWRSETVWNDGGGGGAGGGGISQLFAEPAYQKALPGSVQSNLDGHRGVPDISWNASPDTAILIYASFGGPGSAGYSTIGGTSEGSPQWAGLIADVNEARGNPIGFLNPALYSFAARNNQVFHDIVKGNNGYGGVRGYSAVTGWDPASGLGTPRSGPHALVHALISASART